MILKEVTKLDIEMEEFLATSLKKIYPSIGFKGEEFGLRESSDSFWLVDPIDGTGYFVRGIPGCTCMVALVDSGEVIFSAIYDFINDKLYHASKNEGAFCNNTKIHVSNRTLKEAYLYLECDFEKDNSAKYFQLKKLCMVLTSGYPPGFEYAMVASGKIEGRINFNSFGYDYDFAPGTFLVKEAGGVVTNFGSDKFDYTNLNSISTNKEVYEALVKERSGILSK